MYGVLEMSSFSILEIICELVTGSRSPVAFCPCQCILESVTSRRVVERNILRSTAFERSTIPLRIKDFSKGFEHIRRMKGLYLTSQTNRPAGF